MVLNESTEYKARTCRPSRASQLWKVLGAVVGYLLLVASCLILYFTNNSTPNGQRVVLELSTRRWRTCCPPNLQTFGPTEGVDKHSPRPDPGTHYEPGSRSSRMDDFLYCKGPCLPSFNLIPATQSQTSLYKTMPLSDSAVACGSISRNDNRRMKQASLTSWF
ncbi:hypothetical protein F9C07_1146045 [Aspergillus flavus]|uniref:Uncharacterized protein n=1 Tax=Aspergillus flavus (strain ATCC 200026 / FGSC A1120 / IAM 13836 / NRRL 3357 / JCM 12722 / SRRC 167) TaxID=332952 RepID=A0A7U2MSB7_ASPFN|nr:hypothetical protein F9C07_1146045 [Aspergillus flavus]